MAEATAAERERLRPYAEQASKFHGWAVDLDPQRLVPRPWDYMARARELVASAPSVLDLGNGGAERLTDILTDFSGRAVATEEWEVNAPIAAARLQPFGAGLIRCHSPRLPFQASSFQLILDRHEELDPKEVAAYWLRAVLS